MRSALLQGVKVVIDRQQGLTVEQDDGRFFRERKHGRGRFGATHGFFGAGAATLLGNRFGVDDEAGG